MPGRVFNSVVHLQRRIDPPSKPKPTAPTSDALFLLTDIPHIKNQLYDASGNGKLVRRVDTSGIELTPDLKLQLDAYLKYVEDTIKYLDSIPPEPTGGSPVIHSITIPDAIRSNWNTKDFIEYMARTLLSDWNAIATPLRRYEDASGYASFRPYRMPYRGRKMSNTTVTRFSQFVACELGPDVAISARLLSQTFVRALRGAMFHADDGRATEMGSNAFAQLMNADVGDKTNVLIRDVSIDSDVTISPYASLDPITSGDFIIELIVC